MDSKVVVITGASSGIGAALAMKLGAADHILALAARREHELKQVAGQSGSRAIAVVCDVTRRGDMEHLRDVTLEEFERIDVWINNAGRGVGRKVLELSDRDFDEIIDVNLKSVFYGMQTIVPYFQGQGKGHLINMSSFLSRVPFVTFRSIYSASKAAMNILTANLRMDLSAEYPNIHVSVVMPGGVMTDFPKNALGGTPQMPARSWSVKRQSAEEVAAVIVDLIANPRPEVYTNPALAEIAANYYKDVGAFEKYMHRPA